MRRRYNGLDNSLALRAACGFTTFALSGQNGAQQKEFAHFVLNQDAYTFFDQGPGGNLDKASMMKIGEFARVNGVEGSITVGKVLPKTPEHTNGKQPVRPMPSPIFCHAYSPGSLTFTKHLHTYERWA